PASARATTASASAAAGHPPFPAFPHTAEPEQRPYAPPGAPPTQGDKTMKHLIDTTTHRSRLRGLLAAGAIAVAVAIAGCGGGGGYGSTGTKASTGGAGRGTPLNVTSDPKLGKILVDAKGRTLYDFVIDKGT